MASRIKADPYGPSFFFGKNNLQASLSVGNLPALYQKGATMPKEINIVFIVNADAGRIL